MSHKIYLLARIRKFLDEAKAILIYKQMIVPYADYAHYLVDCTTQDLTKKVNRLQGRGLQVARYNNMYEKCSVTELHTYFKMDTLDSRRFKQLLNLMYKVSIAKGEGIPLADRRTRGDHKIKIPCKQFKYKALSKCPLLRGVWEWDGLDKDIQKLDSIDKFKASTSKLKPRPVLV